MAEHTLVGAFKRRVAPHTVLIRRLFNNEQGQTVQSQGSGVIIGQGHPEENSPVHILTAGHVLDGFDKRDGQWFIQRSELDEEGRSIERGIAFQGSDLTDAGVPSVLCTKYLRQCDIGLLAIPNVADDGGWLIDPAKHKRLQVVTTTGYLQPGARVAWCGLPGYVADLTDSYLLCYFEGITACVPDNPPLYLVDGHSAHGVSGGPMWMLQEDGEPVIIGVCVSFHQAGELPAGLIGFCPVQVLLRYIERVRASLKT